jgi:hypothetical protein
MAIVKKHILRELKRLDSIYSALGATADVQRDSSRLAVIELCGWVEHSFDAVAERAIHNHVFADAELRKSYREAIKKNYGFDYYSNFIRMMNVLVGVKLLDDLSRNLDGSGRLAILTGQLTLLKDQRNSAAHVHSNALLMIFDAPSVTLGRLHTMFPIMREIYSWTCRYC